MNKGHINAGLTSTELTTFKEYLIKANYEQLKAMEDTLINEMYKRR
jgi:hypothetical protein